MNPISSLLCLLVLHGSAQAALAPIHQNPKDLAVMIAFVQQTSGGHAKPEINSPRYLLRTLWQRMCRPVWPG